MMGFCLPALAARRQLVQVGGHGAWSEQKAYPSTTEVCDVSENPYSSWLYDVARSCNCHLYRKLELLFVVS